MKRILFEQVMFPVPEDEEDEGGGDRSADKRPTEREVDGSEPPLKRLKVV